MGWTEHYKLPEMPVGAVDWPAIFNDLVAKLEAGRTLKLTAAVDLFKGDPFYINGAGQAAKATDATDCDGVWQSSETANTTEGYGQIGGTMTFGSGWVPGGKLYVSAGGALTQTVGSVSVGKALTATVIRIGTL